MAVKEKQQLKVVGHSVPRLDADDKVRGKLQYGIDYTVPGMHVGKVLRSPHAHALIRNIDASGAIALPGVKAVVTSLDIPVNKYGAIRDDEYLFAHEKVRYAGEEVCGVVAVDEETAAAALKRIHVEYEELDYVTHPLDALKEGAPQIHRDCPDNVALSYQIARGDVDQAFRKAHRVVSGRYEIPMSHQTHLEPLAAVVEVSGKKLTVHTAAQEAFFTRREIAHCLALEETDVIIHVLMAGGGFGARCDQKLPLVAAALAWKAGVSVKLVNNREDEMASGRPLMPVVVDLELAVDREGRFLGKKTRITAENGAYTSVAPAMLSVAATRSDSLYRYPALFTEAALVYTNKPPSSAYRGFGNQQIHFPMESLIDEAATALGKDPVELRLLNATREGDISIHGWEIKSCGLTQSLMLVRDKYRELAQHIRDSREVGSPKRRGLGVAAFIHVSGNRTTLPEFGGSSAMIKFNHNGKVQVFSGETCVGQGVHTVFAQIAAEVLGLNAADVEVVLGNTDETPFALGCHASRVTTLGGNAVLRAARDAAEKIRTAAAGLTGGVPDDIEIDGGFIYNRTTGRKLSFAEVARHVVLVKQSGIPLISFGVYEPAIEMPDMKTKYGNLSAAYPFGAHLVEVEVDTETGSVEVKRVFAVHDSGKAINPMMIEGQIEGGVAMGIGFTLFEEMIYEQGVLKNKSLADYKIPTMMDIPPIQVALVETEDPEGPFGAKGVGETPLLATAPAIANAIYHATGVRIRKLPFTPQHVHAQLTRENEDC